MVAKVLYVCEDCGMKEELKFNNSQEAPYADDVIAECGWWQDEKGMWHCPECMGCENE